MQLGKELLKKDVISLANGKRLGRVEDLYLGSSLERITALYLGTEGNIFNRTPCMVPFERVARLGSDVVLVDDENAVQEEEKMAQVPLWTRLQDLRGRDVDTTGGTHIGQIEDVIVDESGQVLGYRLSNIEVRGPIAEKQAIALDTITDFGHDGALTIDLEKAERQTLSLRG